MQRNADRLGEYPKKTNRDPASFAFRAVMDAANEPSNESFPSYESSRRSSHRGFAVVLSARFDESCLALHVSDPWRCSDGAHLRANHITSPYFARQDLIDSNTLYAFGTALRDNAKF